LYLCRRAQATGELWKEASSEFSELSGSAGGEEAALLYTQKQERNNIDRIELSAKVITTRGKTKTSMLCSEAALHLRDFATEIATDI